MNTKSYKNKLLCEENLKEIQNNILGLRNEFQARVQVNIMTNMP